MRRGRRWLFALRLAAMAAGFSLPLAAVRPIHDLPPPIQVVVDGRVKYLKPTITFGDVLGRFGLKAEAGDLLDVEGFVLRNDVYRGAILLNGFRGVAWQGLSDGDRIDVAHGQDRTEPLVEQVRVFPGGRARNPQFILSTQPGEQITVRGRISGKLVSVVFEPTGEAEVRPAVALTFDDGPHPVYTPQVLATLRKFNVPATFFVVGNLAERYPQLIRKEARIGTVATHSWSHPIDRPFRKLRPERMEAEIARGVDALAELGIQPTLFRPPGGSYGQRVVATAHELGLRTVLWSVDPRDWRDDARRREIVRHVLAHVGPGAIILLHDGGGDQSATVAALPRIIKGIRKMGLRFALVARPPGRQQTPA